MGSQKLTNFDIIESQKENIQPLPSGRSAKKLAELFSGSPMQKRTEGTSPDTKLIHDSIRADFEAEIASSVESDDPLDVYDRFVRWTLDAYPSAQATAQSQLHTLLERATKAFVKSSQYKNDPRYLRLWLHYTHLFSDAPRESFVFLSRHGIGEKLALFYEEYAAWLEGAGRWSQAEEVYKLGLEREAGPAARLMRKHGEFQQRRARRHAVDGTDVTAEDTDGPSSPALPVVRPALAAKLDPFAVAAAENGALDGQAQRQNPGLGGARSKPGRAKMAIFSDTDPAPTASAFASGAGESEGWQQMSSLAERKKENVMAAKPWAGETLKAGGTKSNAPKMAVFRDSSLVEQVSHSHIAIHHHEAQATVNARNGRKERVFVDLRQVYPTPDEPGTELSFEEIWAANRGWLDQKRDEADDRDGRDDNDDGHVQDASASTPEVETWPQLVLDENGEPVHACENRARKKKVMEVNETQIIKAKLDSPSGPKMRRRQSTAEPTMTLHTRAATDDIYEILNAPLPSVRPPDEISEGGYETDDYTSGGGGDSTVTSRHLAMGGTDGEEDEGGHGSDAGDELVNPRSEQDDEHGQREDTQLSDLINFGGQDEDEQDEEHELATPVVGDFLPNLPPLAGTSFVPIPPEDYVPASRTYRDPVEMANNRLPFMTPITERTESSLDLDKRAEAKTPSRRQWPRQDWDGHGHGEEDAGLEAFSSPLREVVQDMVHDIVHDMVPDMGDEEKPVQTMQEAVGCVLEEQVRQAEEPIIQDSQCNPVERRIRDEILEKMQPRLSRYDGFYDHRQEPYGKGGEIRRWARAIAKNGRNSSDRSNNGNKAVVLRFPDTKAEYRMVRELGAGAFAPVYLVEKLAAETGGSKREAVKMELPPTAWEFHMMRLAHERVGRRQRAAASLSEALEMHLYQDEGFLILPLHPHGTLLDVINLFRSEPGGVMDESLAMFFAIELLRTVEALHEQQLLHGDLKADNCLLRLPGGGSGSGSGEPGEEEQQHPAAEPVTRAWTADGSGGWRARGLTLIDFGRSIDMCNFSRHVRFMADWEATPQDCAEVREGQPWTWQLDYHGLAAILHCLLFGRYMETVRCEGGGGRYRVRESLKRYWQADLWGACFDLLLNSAASAQGEDGAAMPLLRGMRAVRERMEAWLEANGERGVGLRSLMAKVEAWAKGRR